MSWPCQTRSQPFERAIRVAWDCRARARGAVGFRPGRRLVALLSRERRRAGWHDVWGGRDRNGRPVASGAYCQAERRCDVTRRIVVLR